MTHRVVPVQQPSPGMVVMRRLMARVRARYAERIWPEISNPAAAQAVTMPHVVECPGLTVHDRGVAFAEEFQGRRLWCREHCKHGFAVEPIWDNTKGRDTGRRFLFADQKESAMFRREWD